MKVIVNNAKSVCLEGDSKGFIYSPLSSLSLIWRAPKSTADLQETQLAKMETKMLKSLINLPLIFDNFSSAAIKVSSRVGGGVLSRSHSKTLVD